MVCTKIALFEKYRPDGYTPHDQMVFAVRDVNNPNKNWMVGVSDINISEQQSESHWFQTKFEDLIGDGDGRLVEEYPVQSSSSSDILDHRCWVNGHTFIYIWNNSNVYFFNLDDIWKWLLCESTSCFRLFGVAHSGIVPSK